MIEQRKNRVENCEEHSEEEVRWLRGAVIKMTNEYLEGSEGRQMKEEQETQGRRERGWWQVDTKSQGERCLMRHISGTEMKIMSGFLKKNDRNDINLTKAQDILGNWEKNY